MSGLTLVGLALLRARLTALLVLTALMLLAAMVLLAVLVELDRLAGLFLVALTLHVAIALLIHLALIALLLFVVLVVVHCCTCSSPGVLHRTAVPEIGKRYTTEPMDVFTELGGIDESRERPRGSFADRRVAVAERRAERRHRRDVAAVAQHDGRVAQQSRASRAP